MYKLKTADWRKILRLGMSLALLVGLAAAVSAMQSADPDMGFGALRTVDPASSPMHAKLHEALEAGAEAYRGGDFAQAVQWYESALQLNPEHMATSVLLENARRMHAEQQKALETLPRDAKDRQRYLETSYDQILSYYKEGKYEQACHGLHQLWVSSGDFNGKILKMLRKSQRELQKTVEPATVDQPALPVDGFDEQAIAEAVAEVTSEEIEATRAELADLLEREPLNEAARQQLEQLEQAASEADAPVVPPLGWATSAPVNTSSGPEVIEIAQAPETSGEPLSDVARLQSNRLVYEAEQLVREGENEAALNKIEEALKAWPNNPRAREMREFLTSSEAEAPTSESAEAKATGEIEEPTTPTTARTEGSIRRQLYEMHRNAQGAYEAGDVRQAREIWHEMLDLDPGNKVALTWLEMTEEAYTRLQADEEAVERARRLRGQREELLNAPITLSTDHEITLNEFMSLLSFTTPVELQFYIAEGARAMIFANFVDKPLEEVLDTVLVPRGLQWTIDENNVVVITPNLLSRTYTLTPAQMSQVRTLLDAGNLQQLIWGQPDPPAEGVDIILDERQRLLLVTGSELHVNKMESFLASIQEDLQTDLVVRIYKIKESDGPRIRALINSIVQAPETSPFEIERKVLIDGDDLIIRDTPENIRKIEELLLDKEFIQRIRDEELDLQNFSLVPKDVENTQSDQIQVFTSRVVEAIRVFLYAQEGESKAAEQGRRMWFDEYTLQLTIVDTPSNLRRVADYIEQLPELRQRQLQKVLFLDYAVAEDMVSSLEQILELTRGDVGVGGGDEVTFRLRRGESREFRGAVIRMIRVEENDEEDRNDDSVELQVNAGAQQINQITLREFDTQFVDDYEVTAEDVLPSSGQEGEGSARITVRYVPEELAELDDDFDEEELEEELTTAEEMGISINAFGELNAIIIRYTNPILFQEALSLVEQLDQPVKQVEIETKFVEVNENRAKEFSADLNIAGLGSGRDVDWANHFINTRFAQDIDEFRDVFGPPIENPLSANLIKGTSVIDAIIPGFPNVEYSLRLLEAEGIINLVNGPKVTAIDGEEARFRIEQYVAGGDPFDDDELTNIINPLDQFGDLQLAEEDEATQNDELITAVVLRFTPEITSEESIRLQDLSAELIDFGGWVGNVIRPELQDVEDLTEDALFTPIVAPQAISNVGAQFLVKRKRIETFARVSNGGTIVIGGWTGERSQELTSGVPVLRNLPYFGKLLFSRNQRSRDRTTLLIFLTAYLVD